MQYFENPSERYLSDKISDMKEELNKKNEMIELLKESLNKILKKSGVENNVLILSTTDSKALKENLNKIEEEVENNLKVENKVQEREPEQHEVLTVRSNLKLSDNIDNLINENLEQRKPDKTIDAPLQKPDIRKSASMNPITKVKPDKTQAAGFKRNNNVRTTANPPTTNSKPITRTGTNVSRPKPKSNINAPLQSRK